jgi:hypothetical protein
MTCNCVLVSLPRTDPDEHRPMRPVLLAVARRPYGEAPTKSADERVDLSAHGWIFHHGLQDPRSLSLSSQTPVKDPS